MQDVLELAPDSAVTARWSVAGVGLVAVTGWLLVRSDGHPLAWMLAVASLVVTAVFVAQFLVPRAFRWELGPAGLRIRHPLRPLSVPWSSVHLARVVTSAGEPALELHVDTGRDRMVRTATLPLGADVDALHRALARWLGPLEGAAGLRPQEPEQVP